MSPKKRKSTASQASSAKKPTSVESAPVSDAVSVLEAQQTLESASSIPAAKRALKRRSTVDEVDRKINSHFPEMTATQKETTKVDDMTIFERVLRDTRAARSKENPSRLGAAYWKELEQLYQANSSSSSALQVSDPNAAVNDALVEALSAAVNTLPAMLGNFFATFVLFLLLTVPF